MMKTPKKRDKMKIKKATVNQRVRIRKLKLQKMLKKNRIMET